MAVDNVDALAQHNVAEHGEKGEHSGESGRAVDDQIGNVVDLEAISKVANPRAAIVCVRDDDDFVAPVHEFARQLVDVTFHPARLREEKVANHSDIVCWSHLCDAFASNHAFFRGLSGETVRSLMVHPNAFRRITCFRVCINGGSTRPTSDTDKEAVSAGAMRSDKAVRSGGISFGHLCPSNAS